MRIKRGITRTVWLIGPWAIKFPTMRYAGTFFFRGCGANLEEAWKWKDHQGKGWTDTMCPVLWCGWFGLFLIMPRLKPYTGNDRPPEYRRCPYTTDHKPENYGIDKRGNVVCVDYA